ncbi:SHOCT domain-containing protein [Halobacterium rubrum]|uniref:SHOCT domain-containing protein n=1 Tax=Halobacterium TaxID=2239 RepID=UPI001F1FA386|nr:MULTISPECIES: SHOCT domain-containing protein [Halobacterium]MDH5020628.1 SHOCT domain-containing protein [Halobacterium rubrum]MDH5020657.1 SHOCT domain-containing protein [Halobacterium rubrum]
MTRDTATPTKSTTTSSTTTSLGRTARKFALATGGVLVAATSTASATAVAGHHHGGGGMGAGTWGVGVGGGMWLWGLLWMGVLFAVLALAARALFDWGRDTDQPQPERSPQDVLRERYARGDLDDDEFERRRQTLRSDE